MLDIDGARVMPFKHQRVLFTPLPLFISPATPSSSQIILSAPLFPPVSPVAVIKRLELCLQKAQRETWVWEDVRSQTEKLR